jgi:hypothetical protein
MKTEDLIYATQHAKLIQIPEFNLLHTALGKDLCFVICDTASIMKKQVHLEED